MRRWWDDPNHPAWGGVLFVMMVVAYALILLLIAVGGPS